MCDLENCSIGTEFLVYTNGKRTFAAMACENHLAAAIKNKLVLNSNELIVVEKVN